MTNEQMLAALGRLPLADLMTPTKISDPLGAGAYYRADTVLRLLAAERERCAKLIEDAHAWTGGHGEPCSPNSHDLTRRIRAL